MNGAHLVFAKCPAEGCDEILNSASLTRHIKRVHPELVAKVAA